MSLMSQEYFARKLVSVHDWFHWPDFDIEHFSKTLMQAFLFFGSETHDNQQCVEAMHFGAETPSGLYYILYGFKLRHKSIFVQDIYSVLQTLSLPSYIKTDYPDLIETEWQAVLLTTMKIIEAFSPRKYPTREPGWNVGSAYLARKLLSLYDRFDYPDFDVEGFNYRIMQILIDFDWINPLNQQTQSLIEYGEVPSYWSEQAVTYGFKLKGKSILITDILNALEGLPILDEVSKRFPELQSNELAALLRMGTMIVLAFSPSR